VFVFVARRSNPSRTDLTGGNKVHGRRRLVLAVISGPQNGAHFGPLFGVN
jgi:hypothetical protein